MTPTRVAMLSALALMAHQVGGKAVRDALYLSEFAVTTLPRMLVLASALSIAGALVSARLLTRLGPARLIGRLFVGSALLSIAEWSAYPVAPGPVTVTVFLHVAALGSLLISGFWAAFGEAFDPRTVRRTVGSVAAAATLGGVLGGAVAERVGTTFGIAAVLPVLAVMHVACAWLTSRLPLPEVSDAEPVVSADDRRADGDGAGPETGVRTLRSTPYLRDLAAVVVLTAVVGTLVDYVFKARATLAFTDGRELVRFFAIFYTGVSVLTFLVQSIAGRRALERVGLTVTMASLPAVVGLGAAGALIVPTLAGATWLRASEQVLRSSLYRGGYELLFTPLAPRQKRGIKSIVDVAFDRLGDVVGAALVALVLLALPAGSLPVLLVLSLVAAALGLWIVRRLGRGYVTELEKSLLRNRVSLDEEDVLDRTTRTTLMTVRGLRIVATGPSGRDPGPPAPAAPAVASDAARDDPDPAPAEDDDEPRLRDLRSRNADRVVAALARSEPPSAAEVGEMIALLAWDAVSQAAIDALRRSGDEAVEPLAAALVDPEQHFAVRRRVPRAMAGRSGPRVIDALTRGLEDRRFEVRYQCGLALARIRRDRPDRAALTPGAVFAVVAREARASASVWRGQRLLDDAGGESDWSRFGSAEVDRVIRERSTRSLEHVFTLLSLVLPREPLRVAYCALHDDDAVLRGTALEYLESTLPREICEVLWPHLEADLHARPAPLPGEDRDAALERLLRSNRSIMARLEEAAQSPRPDLSSERDAFDA